MKELFWTLCVVSGVLFLATSFSLLGGACGPDSWSLEYISTQLAACLNTFPEASWVFVVALQVQTFLLLHAWERLFRSTKLLGYFECVVTMTAASFIVCMASVVEFRNDRLTRSATYPDVVESNLHNYAAVGAIVSFGGLHLLLALSLLDLSACEQQILQQQTDCSAKHASCLEQYQRFREHQWFQEYKQAIGNYTRLDKLYCLCVLVFLITWSINGIFVVAAVAEWTVLLVGTCMHIYALMQITRPLPWVSDDSPASARSNLVKASCVLSLLLSVAFTTSVFLFAPVSVGPDEPELHTSVFFLLVVLSTYAGAALVLSHYSFGQRACI